MTPMAIVLEGNAHPYAIVADRIKQAIDSLLALMGHAAKEIGWFISASAQISDVRSDYTPADRFPQSMLHPCNPWRVILAAKNRLECGIVRPKRNDIS